MPIVLVDWSDIREHMRLMALRASITCQGRLITLYEKSFSLSQQDSRAVNRVFLSEWAAILPASVTPLIVSDAGFKEVERHGWF